MNALRHVPKEFYPLGDLPKRGGDRQVQTAQSKKSSKSLRSVQNHFTFCPHATDEGSGRGDSLTLTAQGPKTDFQDTYLKICWGKLVLGRGKLLCLYAIALLSSAGQALKHGGVYALSGMALVYLVLFLVCGDEKLLEWTRTVRPLVRRLVSATLLVVLTIAAVELYPIANSQSPGQGSDNDDAVANGALYLVASKNPYGYLTYLHNPPATLPTSFYLAVPFALVGHIELQNVFWILIAILLLVAGSKGTANGLAILGAIFILGGLSFCQQVITGSDRIANAFFVCAAVLLVFSCLGDRESGQGKLPLTFGVLGFVLASRINLAVVLCPLFFHILGRKKPGTVLLCGLAVCGGFVSALLPVWPENWHSFEPIAILMSKIGRHASAPVWCIWLSRALTAGCVLGCSLLAYRGEERTAFWAMSMVVAVPFLSMTCLGSIQTQSFYGEYLDYLILSLPFTLAARFRASDREHPATGRFETRPGQPVRLAA